MRMAMKNSLVFVWIAFHETSTHRILRSVVRNRKRILIPSIPIIYLIPQVGIHSCISTNCILYVLLSKLLSRGREIIKVEIVKNRAVHLTRLAFLINSSTSAPINGRNTDHVSIG
jgi:hypothetical protein